MNVLMDKIILLVLCLVPYLRYSVGIYQVVPVILALAASALNSYFDQRGFKRAIFLFYCAAGLYFPTFLFFLPLVGYDMYQTGWPFMLSAILPIGANIKSFSIGGLFFIGFLLILSYVFMYRTSSMESTKSEYLKLRDDTKEFSLQLESKNRELLEKQDYEINLATLNERQRIARDIHDNIGHLLSNSILQTGALLATCRDVELRSRLNVLKDTLNAGMDSIRESIHDMYDESIDLYSETKKLIDGFQFCEISLDYDMDGNPDKKVKYTLLAVLKEGLSNIQRHSNATMVRITLREHPALYQLIIRDNGSKKKASGEGIGLKNIAQRVSALNGIVTINSDNGFVLFVNLPKEQRHENSLSR